MNAATNIVDSNSDTANTLDKELCSGSVDSLGSFENLTLNDGALEENSELLFTNAENAEMDSEMESKDASTVSEVDLD
jgi:hypothetical protein